METRAKVLSDEKNVQNEKQEAVSSRCVRPKVASSASNRQYPPVVHAATSHYDPNMRMYFFYDKRDELPPNATVSSEPEERSDASNVNAKKMCTTL